MSYTIVDDNGVLNIRAVISSLDELNEFRDKIDKVRMAILPPPDCPPVKKEVPHAG